MRLSTMTLSAAAIVAGLAPLAASAQTRTITLYELPAYLGRSVTITSDTPDLATQSFARRAQSARVTGEWQLCPTEQFAGTCRTVTTSQPYLSRSAVASVRETPSAAVAASTTTSLAGGTTAASTAIDLDSLDAGAGTDGQDVSFYARPSLGGSELSAGTNDVTTATAFCKLAGATSATAAGRARVQASNLIDLSTRTRVRGFALRDVLCRR